MQTPKLSIIIPHYNTPDRLKNLLDSIIREAEETEIIVIDDKSDRNIDEYQECVKLYSDRVIFLDNNTDKKDAGTARNIGLKRAIGKWLLFGDADDCFLPGWFDVVKSHYEDDADIVFFSPVFKHQDKNNLIEANNAYDMLCKNYVPGDTKTENKLRFGFVVPWSKLVKKELIEKYNIEFDAVRFGNDQLFSAKVGLYAEKISVDTRTIYCYFKGVPCQLTSYDSEEIFSIRTETYCKKLIFLKQHGIEWNSTLPVSILRQIVKRKYGFGSFRKYISLFKKYNIPIMNVHIAKEILRSLPSRLKRKISSLSRNI